MILSDQGEKTNLSDRRKKICFKPAFTALAF